MTDHPHGTASAYQYYRCSCPACLGAHMTRMRAERAARLARRVLVDGRLVAPVPPEKHGKATTYGNWGCRCEPCTQANNAGCYARRVERRRRAKTAA